MRKRGVAGFAEGTSSGFGRRVAHCVSLLALGALRAVPAQAVDPLPDLVVTAVDASGLSRVCALGRVTGTVQVTVANAGAADVTTAFRIAVFEDRDHDGTLTSGPGSSDAVLGEATVTASLAVDASPRPWTSWSTAG